MICEDVADPSQNVPATKNNGQSALRLEFRDILETLRVLQDAMFLPD